MEGKVFTIKEVAEYLKVNERTVYRLASSGEMPAFKVGGSWRVKKEELTSWINQQSNQQ